MSETPKFDLKGAQFGGGFAAEGDVSGGSITHHHYATDTNLAEAAKEIKQLLEELEKTYPSNTEQTVLVREAIERLENNPTLKQRVVGALRQGGIEAFKGLVDNPWVDSVLAGIEGWNSPD